MACGLVLLAGCTGAEPLSEAMGAINRQYGELQDQAMVRNILRRSVGLPPHFTSLTTLHGRNRLNAGAGLSLPFGPDAPARVDFTPRIEIERGPDFQVSSQANSEFYRGYLAPVGAATAHVQLHQDHAPELVLSLMIERIHLRDRHGRDQLAVNAPGQPSRYAAFQTVIERLVDEGLATEEAQLVRDVGPEIAIGGGAGVANVLAARDKGLQLEEVAQAGRGRRHYRLRQIDTLLRFCFRRPTEPPFQEARCRSGAAPSTHRFAPSDGRFFGSLGGAATAALDAGEAGRLEIQTRSLAGIIDYLGTVVRVQSEGGAAPMIRTQGGREPLFVLLRDPPPGRHIVEVDFRGSRYAVPAGPSGGQSGAALTIVSQLLAQAQSVRDLPASNAVTIVGN